MQIVKTPYENKRYSIALVFNLKHSIYSFRRDF